LLLKAKTENESKSNITAHERGRLLSVYNSTKSQRI